MTYFRCVFQFVSISSSEKTFGFSRFKKIRGQEICRGSRLPLYTFTCVFVYNVLQWFIIRRASWIFQINNS